MRLTLGLAVAAARRAVTALITLESGGGLRLESGGRFLLEA